MTATTEIGADLAADTYVTTSAASSCYWERVTAFDDRFESIISNDLGSGQRIVTIQPSDYGVSFSRCGTWTRSADAPASATVGDGVYRVGTDLAPGTYRAAPTKSGCYWATVSAFDGKLSSIIANDYRDDASPVIVDIPNGTIGFESSNCGTWTRV